MKTTPHQAPVTESSNAGWAKAQLSGQELLKGLQDARQEYQRLNKLNGQKSKELPEWAQKTAKEIAARISTERLAPSESSDALIRLALAEARGEYQRGCQHHHCGCGSDATGFREKAKQDGLGDLVRYEAPRDNCPFYWIPSEQFDAARSKLIATRGTAAERRELEERSEFLKKTSQKMEELEQRVEALALQEAVSKLQSQHGLSLTAAQALSQVRGLECVKSLDPDTFAYVTDRSEYGSSGGCGYFSELWVYHHGRTELRSYQWRDRFSADNDRPALAIHGLGKISQKSTADGKVAITAELINKRYGNRSVTVPFEALPADVPSFPALTAAEQRALRQSMAAAQEAILEQKAKLMPLKPRMQTRHGEACYFAPKLKQSELAAELGIGAFVIEEQIDHAGEDRQMRYELYLVTKEQPAPRHIFERHGYDSREGNAAIGIVRIGPKAVTVSTREGLQEAAF